MTDAYRPDPSRVSPRELVVTMMRIAANGRDVTRYRAAIARRYYPAMRPPPA